MLQNEAHGRFAVFGGFPEVPLQGVFEKTPVLHVERLVEPHEFPQVLDVFVGRIGIEHHQDGVARHVKQEKHDDHDALEEDDCLNQALYDISGH